MVIPMLALLNIFISNPGGGTERTLSKCTDQTNVASRWKDTVFLLGVCEATVASYTSPSTEVRLKNLE